MLHAPQRHCSILMLVVVFVLLGRLATQNNGTSGVDVMLYLCFLLYQ